MTNIAKDAKRVTKSSKKATLPSHWKDKLSGKETPITELTEEELTKNLMVARSQVTFFTNRTKIWENLETALGHEIKSRQKATEKAVRVSKSGSPAVPAV